MGRSACFARMFVIGLIFSAAVNGAEQRHRDDWSMYGRDLQHTFDNPDSAITPNNVSQLQPAWIFPTGDVVSASPAVFDPREEQRLENRERVTANLSALSWPAGQDD